MIKKDTIDFYERVLTQEQKLRCLDVARAMSSLEDAVRDGHTHDELIEKNYIQCLLEEYRLKYKKDNGEIGYSDKMREGL